MRKRQKLLDGEHWPAWLSQRGFGGVHRVWLESTGRETRSRWIRKDNHYSAEVQVWKTEPCWKEEIEEHYRTMIASCSNITSEGILNFKTVTFIQEALS